MKKRLLIVCGCALTVLALVGALNSRQVSARLRKLISQQTVKEDRIELSISTDLEVDEENLSDTWLQPIWPDRLLVAVVNTLYLLDAEKKVLWQVMVPNMPGMVYLPTEKGNGMIYGVAADQVQFSVELTTGQLKIFGDRISGSASYTQIQRYKDDQYLIVTWKGVYRDRFPDQYIPDYLTIWRGEESLWSTEIPPNAKIETWGERILAVTKEKNKMIVTEIKRPEQEVK
jgi:hypothetical protein